MAEFTVPFTFEKSTKNTHRFKENVPAEGETPLIGTIYVQRSAFSSDTPPTDILLTAEWSDS